MTTHWHNIEWELKKRSEKSGSVPIVDMVRRSCRDVAQLPGCPVKIDQDRLRAFVRETDANAIRQSSHFMDNPITFREVQAEMNFHLTLHLFNFGHGFRHPLHSLCGCGAWQTMKKGILALHLSTKKGWINAQSLIDLSVEQVDNFFGFPKASSDHGRELAPLRDIILEVAHSSGARLAELGYASFADFVFDHSSSVEPSALQLVESLAGHFPAFDDRRCLTTGQEVFFLKKAQIAVAELYQKLGDALSARILFADVHRLTVACDNVLPCVLRTLGIITLNPELAARIDGKQPLPAGDEEAQLRAVAITATEMILQEADGAFWAKELGDYLWTLGKEPGFRKVERHATMDTCFY